MHDLDIHNFPKRVPPKKRKEIDMKLTWKWLKRLSLCLSLLLLSGCGSLSPYITPEDSMPVEEKTTEKTAPEQPVIEQATSEQDKNIEERAVEQGPPEAYSISEAPAENEREQADESPPPLPEEVREETYIEERPPLSSNQELIDSALEYIQASNDFWEQGDLDSAIDSLDKAYSLTLKVKGANDPEVLQQKEDLRSTISKRIIEVYASRFTVANGSCKAIPLVMNRHVEKALALFKGRERKFFLSAYARSGIYRPAIVRALKEAGLPEELSWLPFIESGYKVRALSRARALGMWQFIASTGYKYGLHRDTWIDERMDPEKSTKAAIAYLTELHQIFGDWSTVLAAYNCGEKRVLRQIKDQKINYLDNFWDLYEKLPSETAFYVPKFIALLHIINDPKAYGFDLPPLEKEVEYDKVTISKQILLKDIAKHFDINYSILKELNPELRRQLTPKDPYDLKVPKGKGQVLLANLKDVPGWRPPASTYVLHRVKTGESLSLIASRYNTSIRDIMRMNGLKSRDYVKAGWKLKIPTKYAYAKESKDSSSYSSKPEGKLTEYIVKKGDSLWKIANHFNTTVKAIRSFNRLPDSDLQIGQVLMISTGLSAASEPAKTHKYRVRRGDSPYLIAKKHKMNLYEFLKINDLTPRSTIFPGQIVLVETE